MTEIYPKHISNRKAPENLKQDDLELFQHEYSKEVNATTITTLKKVFILGDSIFNLKELKFYQSYTHIHKLTFKPIVKRLLFFINKTEKIEKAVWIIDNWSEGYFHWLTDALPRLIAASNSIKEHVIILPIEYKKQNYISESLNLLGFKYRFYHKKLFVQELLLPSHTAPTGNYNKNIINQLRTKFLKQNTLTAHRRIFISRDKAQKRKIVNSEAVNALLLSNHFEIHYFEDYSFSQQVEIMMQTKTLVALHGAGLTNMLFMPEQGAVLELRNDNDSHNNCYYTLASELNLRYYYQLNKGNSSNTHAVDVLVNIDELKNNINQLIR